MEVEIRGYLLGLRSNGLYVVKIDVTTFDGLANLRGGAIEFQPDLQLLSLSICVTNRVRISSTERLRACSSVDLR